MGQKRAFLEPGKVRVVERHEGKGPFFVLISGLGGEGEIFSLVTRQLRERGRSFMVVEPPGFGYRSPATDGVTLRDAAEMVVKSGELPDQPTIYVGHSAGAMEAIELARHDSANAIGVVMINGVLDDISRLLDKPWRYGWRYPLKALTLFGLLFYLVGRLPEFVLRRLEQPGHPLSRLFWPMVAQPRKLDRESLRLLVRHNRCKSALRHMRANRHYDLPAHADEVKVPVLAICGKRDPLDTPPNKSEFLSRCPSVEVVVSDTAHCTPIEEPWRVATVLTDFADKLSSTSPPR